MSFNDAAWIIAITLLVSIPWIAALVLAIKDVSRNPSGFTYLLLVVVVGSMPVAFVYLVYRVWRGDEPRAQRIVG